MGYERIKRGLDLLGATLLLVVALPLWAPVALLLLLVQGRPVLFRQQRAGRHGAPFTLYKFRTMRDGDPPRLPDRPVARHPEDERVTPPGRVLRRFAVDELPQLLNVLRGEMSLVGPRPLPFDDLRQPGWLQGVDAEERRRREEWLARRQSVLPGLTGLWQITPHPAADFDNWMTCDLRYVEERAFALDLRILLATPHAVLRGRRAEPGEASHTHEPVN